MCPTRVLRKVSHFALVFSSLLRAENLPRLAGGSPEAVPRENSSSEPSGFVAAWRKEDVKFPLVGQGL